MKARVIANPYNLGNGYYKIGQIVDVERDTANYYVLVNSCYRISKKTMALTGWAGRYAHSIEFEIIADAPDATAPAPVAMNTEILIATPYTPAETASQVAEVAECLGSLGPVAKDYDPISEAVARVFARLPAGVAVREALDRLGELPFVLTAYPLGAQDMIPDHRAPVASSRPGDLPAPWVYQCGLSGEDFLYNRQEWRQDVEDGNTQRGYWDWVEAQIEEEADAADLEVRQALAAGSVVVLVARELVDAATVAEIGAWLNNGGRLYDFAVFPDDLTQVIGNLSEDCRVDLEREIRGWLAEKEGESLPHAVISVGSVWNARDVPPLDLAGVINRVARSYSGISLELGENLPDANALVITWDRSPSEAAEREIRAALVQELNKMADARPACCLSLSVPFRWHTHPVDRDALAAWCGRQGGGDFDLALSVAPSSDLGIRWVAGAAPVQGLEAGILADARTWLNEGARCQENDDAEGETAQPPKAACRMTITVPHEWNGRKVDVNLMRSWCEKMSKGFTLELLPVTGEPGAVAVSWASGADPASVRPNLYQHLAARASELLDNLYPSTAAGQTFSDPCRVAVRIPESWNGQPTPLPFLQSWAHQLAEVFPSAEIQIETSDGLKRGEVKVKVRSKAEPSAMVFPGGNQVKDRVIARVKSKLNELCPGPVDASR